METQKQAQEIILLHERICSALGDSTRILILYQLSQKDLFENDQNDHEKEKYQFPAGAHSKRA